MSERLADERIQRFLASREVAVLATVDPDGAPAATPMWFVFDDATLGLVTQGDTAKVRHLRRDPRCCLVAETGTRGTIKGVSVRGRAVFVTEPGARQALVERLLARYDPDLARLWGGRAMPADRLLFQIVPAHVRSWGLGS